MKIRRNIEERNLIIVVQTYVKCPILYVQNFLTDSCYNHLSCSALQRNAISGTIPEEFGNLISLTMLDLDNNLLTGEIPPSLGNLSKLQFLYVLLSESNSIFSLCNIWRCYCKFVLEEYHYKFIYLTMQSGI